MGDIALRTENLSKRYRLGTRASYHRFTELLEHFATAPLRWAMRTKRAAANRETADELYAWALRNVSFEVNRGEVVGIIGRNGAGKSTLLKVLSRITEPTGGVAEIYGRVGSLLEVGTGFHPELTGRENILLGGAVIGMKRSEIMNRFDEIVAFSEVEKFLDTPVKRYSSGMYMRLAFAVAAHLEPEILIVDEVLAVGDAQFQEKCLGKMGHLAQEGRTVLFVSHNMTAVQNLCQRAILLDEGELREDGPSAEVVAGYLTAAQNITTEQTWDDLDSAPGSEYVKLRRAAVSLADSSGSGLITTRTPVDLVFEFVNLKPGARLNLSLYVYGKESSLAFNTGPVLEPVWNGKAFPGGLFRSTCRIPGDLLNDGRHNVHLLVVEEGRVIYRHNNITVFDVVDDGSTRGAWHGDWVGAVRPMLNWETELLQEDPVAVERH